MTLPASGIITMNDVNSELNIASGTAISLNDALVRALAGIASGAIDMNTLHSKRFSGVYLNSNNTFVDKVVTWYPPAGVTSISILAIGGGASGGSGGTDGCGDYSGDGGGGGGVAYINNYTVVQGQAYTIHFTPLGSGHSTNSGTDFMLGTTKIVSANQGVYTSGGNVNAGTGYQGGDTYPGSYFNWVPGGGGAAGLGGRGGSGGTKTITPTAGVGGGGGGGGGSAFGWAAGGGGGIGTAIQGTSGYAGTSSFSSSGTAGGGGSGGGAGSIGTGGTGGTYGGGGAGGVGASGGIGGAGALLIIWGTSPTPGNYTKQTWPSNFVQ